ncbi:LysR family transcriptional regulator [Pararhizobium haloflavum]|uniref:LysR family transcriptional regulator n=1 Tax=Pararhizobium haloflavum TaxID=2037914 RepID=UPI000C18DA9E|nr:LysR family transcriptional regulator [Pararhizobium haloflavum]
MNRLRNIEIFLEVARAESFSAAARQLGVSRATVTKNVAALERAVGARLLNRDTQNVSLTEAGRTYLEHGGRIVQELDRLTEDLAEETDELRGTIRIGSPPSFGAQHLVPLIAAFRIRHPRIEFALLIDDGESNIVKEGFDLSLRIAPSLRDMSHVAQLMLRVPQLLVAAPTYLARAGRPASPGDLAAHRCLVHILKSPVDHWTLEGPDETLSVRVGSGLRSDFGEVLRQAAVMGEGISLHPSYMVDDDIVEGRLVIVLPAWRPESLAIYALYPQRRFQPRRVRLFLDFMKNWLRSEVDWSALPVKAA